MRVLLDTHLIIWIHTNKKKLTQQVLDIIQNPDNEIFFSSINIWETEIKYLKSKEEFPISGDKLFELCELAGMKCLPILPEHALFLKTLSYSPDAPRSHKDPFDRMLISQAKAENMYLITHDELLPFYNESCVVLV